MARLGSNPCPSRESKDGLHHSHALAHITYFDCRGRILERTLGRGIDDPVVFSAVICCAHCLQEFVRYNVAFPMKVSWGRSDPLNDWRELRSRDALVGFYIIKELP
jgi:hypothetical protein